MSGPDTPRCPHCFEPTNTTPCPHCDWQVGQDNPPPALALGRVLDGRYRVGRVLGHGGFGITYLAWDDNLHLRLAIKEYFPRDSAGRGSDGVSLAVYSGQAGDQFAYGLDRFLEEARTLAHFDQHPGIVTVKNFFRAHGTGYCVMDYVAGITLRQYLDQQPGGRISVDDALKLLTPVMDALRAVHKEGLLHRDLAPDNIYLTQDGRIKLLDFGAARFAASEHSKSLSIILKPGYAPEEQYRAKGKQGPWTDVYGLAATCYRAITGQVPPEALDRLDNDDLVPPSKLGIAITPGQEATLLQALAVKAGQRLQGMAELQQAWRGGGAAAPQPVGEPSGPVWPEVEDTPTAKPQPRITTALLLTLGILMLIGATVALVPFPWPGTTQPTPALVGGASPPLTPPPPTASAATSPGPTAATVGIPTASPATAFSTAPDKPSVPVTPTVASSAPPTATPATATPSPVGDSAGPSNAKPGDPSEIPESVSPHERYRILGKDQDIVEDTRTKLQWQRCSLGQTWNGATCEGEATKYNWDKAQGIAPAGWRLPTKDELASLVYCSSGEPAYWKTASGICKGAFGSPTLYSAVFPKTPTDWFWSSSPYDDDSNYAWCIGFNYGYVGYDAKQSAYNVRLVHGDPNADAQAGTTPPERAVPTPIAPTNVTIPALDPPHPPAAPGEKAPLYYAAALAPTANIPPEAPLCYKFMVAGPEEQLRKLKAKYPGLYDDQITTNPAGGKNLVAKRKDETGKEITYFYSTNPGVCNAYQQASLSPPAPGTGRQSFEPHLVAIPAGRFSMGCQPREQTCFDNEKPAHPVQVAAFALGQTEVTFAEWESCVAAGGCTHKPDDAGWGRSQRPVINVSWDDAQAYVRWLSRATGQAYRLPTEAEWEYAARAGTTTPFSTGACISTAQANYNGNYDNAGCGAETGVFLGKTQPVGSYPANPWGLHEMHGNVWEWVQDCYHDSYTGAPKDGSEWRVSCASSRDRVVRGGSWLGDRGGLRSDFRHMFDTGIRYDVLGLRVARTLTP